MIYTSYFAKLNTLPDNIIPISICAKSPNWYNGLQYKSLAPTYDILMKYKKDHNEEEYKNAFISRVLNKLNASKVVFDLGRLVDKNGTFYSFDICLICYEKPSDFCHRHLVADWLNKAGFECKEWSKIE